MLLLFLYRLYGDISQYVCVYINIYTRFYMWIIVIIHLLSGMHPQAIVGGMSMSPQTQFPHMKKTMNSFDKRGLSKKVVVTVTFSV